MVTFIILVRSLTFLRTLYSVSNVISVPASCVTSPFNLSHFLSLFLSLCMLFKRAHAHASFEYFLMSKALGQTHALD